MITSINPQQLKEIFINAEKLVTSKKEILNNLNVYPVPDGDTGTNMSLTLKEVIKTLDKKKDYSLEELSELLAESSLMGARGNSGVILSQFIGGFCNIIKEKKTISKRSLLKAFKQGTKEAYESVSNPVEGTILTIMRSATEEIEKQIGKKDLLSILKSTLNRSQFSLKKTPDMLDKLKEAGVVDARGAGFVYFLEGLYRSLQAQGEEKFAVTDDFSSPQLARVWEETFGVFGTGGIRSIIDFNYKAIKFTLEKMWWLTKKMWQVLRLGHSMAAVKKSFRLLKNLTNELKLQNIKRSNVKIFKLLQVWQESPEDNYCCEAILINVKKSTHSIKNQLKGFGSSLVVAQKGNITKIHMHTKDKVKAKNEIEKLGKIKEIILDDLQKQHKEFIGKKLSIPKKDKGTAVLATINGKGFKQIYQSFEGIFTIDGGKTMNPSVAEFKKNVEKLDCPNVIILPNNKNVFMAASEAAANCGKDIEVLKTYDQAQGLTTLLNFNPISSISENFGMMKNSLNLVKTFSITCATRDTKIGESSISKGEFFALDNKKVLTCNKNLKPAIIASIKKASFQLVSLYYGKDITHEKALGLEREIRKKFKCETQLYNGGQPHYRFIIALE